MRRSSASHTLPLFPLHTVLFPGGILPLRVFEQRYVEMTKACLANDTTFGVCLITAGEEVMRDASRAAPSFAGIGTEAKIVDWDVYDTEHPDVAQPQVRASPHLGILHVRVQGLQRFSVERHSVGADGLVVGELKDIPPEPVRKMHEKFAPLARLLELVAGRLTPQQFPAERYYDDASWVGYRLAELLPLPLSVKQSMLEINDSEVRLSVLMRFLSEHGLL